MEVQKPTEPQWQDFTVLLLPIDQKQRSTFQVQMFHEWASIVALLIVARRSCNADMDHKQQSTPTHARTDTPPTGLAALTLCANVPAAERSRPCRRDSCAGPSRPQPPAERCDARGPSSSLCRACERARCVQSWSRAAPPRCRHTAKPANGKEELTHLG